MFMFTARYRGQVQSILLHKEMKVPELIDALSYSLGLPEGSQIVGFQDRNGKFIEHLHPTIGLIITPSFVCLNSQDLRNETYDVLIKNTNQNHSALLFSNGANTSGIAEASSMQQPTIGRSQIQQPATGVS